MKKTLSAIVLCAILVGCMLVFASCGGPLSGTYKGDVFNLKFSGDDEVTVSFYNMNATVQGTYKITEKNDGTKTISFDFIENNENTEQSTAMKLLDIFLSPNLPIVEDGDTLKIGSFIVYEFTKQ